MLQKPQIGKRQLEGDSDDDAQKALACGWRIDADDWWFRPKREKDHDIPGNDCDVGDEDNIVLAPDAESALAFDAAMEASP